MGLDHFERFFQSYYFRPPLKNTLLIHQLALFPISIIASRAIHEVIQARFKRFVQLSSRSNICTGIASGDHQ